MNENVSTIVIDKPRNGQIVCLLFVNTYNIKKVTKK